jgi:FkbM family methyltransferase
MLLATLALPMLDTVRKLRPAKFRSALRRRWFERRMVLLKLEAGPPLVSLGTEYGAWDLPDGQIGHDSICYCVGAGGDVSFDLELINRFGALVRCFDPVEAFERKALSDAGGDPRFSFMRIAIATGDGPIRLQEHHSDDSDSVSSAWLYDGDASIEAQGLTIASVMREFGDDKIDLLKLDLEGAEYEVVPTLDLVALDVRILAVQLHHAGGVKDALKLIDAVREQGFRLVAQRPVVKLTFWRPA